MEGKIRAAHVIPRYFPIFGGAETQCRLLIRHLLATGEVEIPFVVTGRVERQNARTERIDDVIVHRLGFEGVGRWQWYWFYLASSWFLIRHRRDFDVIHCHATSVIGLAMTITGWLMRKRVILKLSTNGELLVGTGEMTRAYRLRRLRSTLRQMMARYLVRNSTIVSLNREGAKEVIAAGAGQGVTIPNGVDLKEYRPLEVAARSALRAAHGFGPDDVILLFVGRFVARKGIPVLLDAFNLLESDPRSERLHLCLAGGGKLQEDAVENLVGSNPRGMQRQIHILPPKIPALEYYQMADLFVFPSQREGLPNVVIEAIAVGLPCILSDIDPHVELLETNPQADVRLFATDDAEHLASVIRAVLNSREVRRLEPIRSALPLDCLRDKTRGARICTPLLSKDRCTNR